MALQDLIKGGFFPRDVVLHKTVLKSIGAPSKARIDLRAPVLVLGERLCVVGQKIQALEQGGHRLLHRGVSRAGLRGLSDVGGFVQDACTILVLVAMLSAGATARIELDGKILGPSLQRQRRRRRRGQHRNRDQAAMDASAFFRRRLALQSMMALFKVPSREVIPFDLKGQVLVFARKPGRVRYSSKRARPKEVALSNFGHEALGI